MGKLFGTNGVRGFANKDMNAELALKLGQSLGSFLQPGDAVLIGSDSRTSGPMLKAALAAGLLSTGVRVLDAGVVPTPALQYRVKTSGKFAAGAIVTASHNPPEHNGIKFIDADGTELPSVKEDAIEKHYFDGDFRAAAWDELGEVGSEPGVNEAYVDGIVATVDADAIRAKNYRVVLDTSNGAGGMTAPYLLRKLGCHVITLNSQPDGTFPGHDSEPTPDNVKDLVNSVTAFDADLGVVQDGDADRCVFVDEHGNYLYGDRTLTLVSGQVIRQKGGGTVVTPVSSSSVVEEYVGRFGGTVTYTRVGAPIVARKMIELEADFGGEENGGLIFPEFQHCRDGSMTVAKILEIMAQTGKRLGELMQEIPTPHVRKLKAECPNDKKDAVLQALADAHKGEKVDLTDGVKVFSDDGWVLVRPSGTEPIFRVYADGKTQEQADRIADRALEEIKGLVRKV